MCRAANYGCLGIIERARLSYVQYQNINNSTRELHLLFSFFNHFFCYRFLHIKIMRNSKLLHQQLVEIVLNLYKCRVIFKYENFKKWYISIAISVTQKLFFQVWIVMIIFNISEIFALSEDAFSYPWTASFICSPTRLESILLRMFASSYPNFKNHRIHFIFNWPDGKKFCDVKPNIVILVPILETTYEDLYPSPNGYYHIHYQIQEELSLINKFSESSKYFHSYIRRINVGRSSVGPLRLKNGSLTTDLKKMSRTFANEFSSEYLLEFWILLLLIKLSLVI